MKYLYEEKVYRKTQHHLFAKFVEKRCTDKTILDIGCGEKWLYPFLINSTITSVDKWEKTKPDYVLDVGKEELPFKDNAFDLVLMIDVIEHMIKEEGLFALKEAQRVCRKRMLLLTPVIWDSNENVNEKSFHYGNPNNLHKSLWTPDDFKDFGRIKSVFSFNEYFFGWWYK